MLAYTAWLETSSHAIQASRKQEANTLCNGFPAVDRIPPTGWMGSKDAAIRYMG